MDSTLYFGVHTTLCRFFAAFDKRDWASMGNCLTPEIFIDYSSSGRESAVTMTGEAFVNNRKSAVDNLTKQHSFSNLYIRGHADEAGIFASCNYLILRFDLSNPSQSDNFFHSCGQYEFTLEQHADDLKISSIKQLKLQSWGNESLRGGSKAANVD